MAPYSCAFNHCDLPNFTLCVGTVVEKLFATEARVPLSLAFGKVKPQESRSTVAFVVDCVKVDS